jgi:hypothetical protein
VIANPSKYTDRLVKYLLKVVPTSLETKSFAGYTPLHLAFKLGRVSLVKILIDAGANQGTRDTQANNLIHDAVSNLPADSSGRSVKLLGKMLDLLDPELRCNMFLQRNSSVAMTGATPLHAFIQRTYGSGYHNYEAKWVKQHVAVVKMLLKYSKGEELGTINGSGDLPLHTLITANSRPMVRVLLEFNPKLLIIENAVGRTPLEIAQDQDLAEKFAGPPTVISMYRWNNTDSEDIVNRNSETFVPGYKVDKRSEREKMWALVKKYMTEISSTKRKLVSLNEANEVAKRLGEMSKKRSSGRHNRYRTVEDEEIGSDGVGQGDEIGEWYNTPSHWKEYDDQEENSSKPEDGDEESDESD